MKIQIAKGVKDIDPEINIIKNKILNVITKKFEETGYNPLQTPTIERFDVLSSKYAGGAEILKETFKLTDQGERDLCLRYDLTVPFARYIAMNPNLKLPFKRYQIGQVFRDGPIKLGRFREFTQCDADVVGIKDVFAEAELLNLAYEAFKELNMNVKIIINNRKILDSIITEAKIPKEKITSTILTIDKIKKITIKEIEQELRTKEITEEQQTKLFETIKTRETNEETLKSLKKTLTDETAQQALTETEQLLNYLKQLNTPVIFDPSLARGLTYYTGTVFEIYLENSKIKSSISAGGRYDKMIGDFISNNQEYPAVGISFGIDVIIEAIKQDQEQTQQKCVTKAFIIPIGQQEKSIQIMKELRKNNINTELNIAKKGISKALDYASYYNIPYTILIGEDEIKNKKYTLRNMQTGNEEKLEMTQIIKKLKQ
ncbi:histidine--tRNA ligase [Candidatus Woesearchaeota archaeon]|nr:histidine--tRNA ligase [Candidatus Woesearchaeota archaeon]